MKICLTEYSLTSFLKNYRRERGCMSIYYAILLAFCVSIAFFIGRKKGYQEGAQYIINEWRAWIDESEDNTSLLEGKKR